MLHNNSVRLGTIAALLFSLFPVISGPASAQSALADDAKRRVNLAGRQRMLSQRMSKAACFILTGVDEDNHRQMLDGAFNLFTTTHDALQFGSEEAGLMVETHLPIIAALGEVDSQWRTYAIELQPIMDGSSIDQDALASLNASGLDVLRTMNATVGKTARTYGESLPDLPLILSITIDLAGRQRMFTQKMSKEFCLIDAGVNIAANTATLAETQSFFNSTLEALISGFPGVVLEAPNAEIRTKLLEVRDLWAGPNAVITAVAGGAPITDADRATIARDVEAVLVAMNQAVGMYEFVDG